MAELRDGAGRTIERNREDAAATTAERDLLHRRGAVGLAESVQCDGRPSIELVCHTQPFAVRFVDVEADVETLARRNLEIAEIHREGITRLPRPSGPDIRDRGNIRGHAIAQSTTGAVGVLYRKRVVRRRSRVRRTAFIDLPIAVVVLAVAADFRGWGALRNTTFFGRAIAVVVDAVAALLGDARVDVLVLVVAVAWQLGCVVAVAVAVAVDAGILRDVGARTACVRGRLRLGQTLLDVVAAAVAVVGALGVALAGRLGIVSVAPVQAAGA